MNERIQIRHGRFSFCQDDQEWDAELQVTGSDQASPEYGHDLSGSEFALSDELGAEPEALNEHGPKDELHHSRGHAPCDAAPPVSEPRDFQEVVDLVLFLLLRIERFDRGDVADGALDVVPCGGGLGSFCVVERDGE